MERERMDYINNLKKRHPILKQVIKGETVLWKNEDYQPNLTFPVSGISTEIIVEAKERFQRFAPLLRKIFPELKDGIVSPISDISAMKHEIEAYYQTEITGTLLLKRDDVLPVAGSIKARGGFHEVLAFTESLAFKNGLIGSKDADYLSLLREEAKKHFKQYTIAVGSTGNLGLSIGLIGSALGFRVVVHMSADAKEWKKSLLRENGVKVVEHASDYSQAVEAARKESASDPKSYFVDDEQSPLLFAGYSVAALEIQEQLQQQGLEVNEDSPLFVYLPCGVGGGPGGVAFGLKSIFGDNVHCFFAEPTHSPCMLVGLVTKLHNQISVQELGLDNQTAADGLAVGRASAFVGRIMEQILSGVYTVTDDELLTLLYLLSESEGIFLEPSALAGMKGPALLSSSGLFDSTINKYKVENAIHLVWATGGSLVPNEMREELLERGKKLSDRV